MIKLSNKIIYHNSLPVLSTQLSNYQWLFTRTENSLYLLNRINPMSIVQLVILVCVKWDKFKWDISSALDRTCDCYSVESTNTTLFMQITSKLSHFCWGNSNIHLVSGDSANCTADSSSLCQGRGVHRTLI